MNSNALSLFERHFVVIAAFEIDRSWIRRTMMMVFVYFIVQFEISRSETFFSPSVENFGFPSFGFKKKNSLPKERKKRSSQDHWTFYTKEKKRIGKN